jgi:hypothetical protein
MGAGRRAGGVDWHPRARIRWTFFDQWFHDIPVRMAPLLLSHARSEHIRDQGKVMLR